MSRTNRHDYRINSSCPVLFYSCFGFVARKPGSSRHDNQCHVFAELDADQPSSAIVSFVTKVLIRSSATQFNDRVNSARSTPWCALSFYLPFCFFILPSVFFSFSVSLSLLRSSSLFFSLSDCLSPLVSHILLSFLSKLYCQKEMDYSPGFCTHSLRFYIHNHSPPSQLLLVRNIFDWSMLGSLCNINKRKNHESCCKNVKHAWKRHSLINVPFSPFAPSPDRIPSDVPRKKNKEKQKQKQTKRNRISGSYGAIKSHE